MLLLLLPWQCDDRDESEHWPHVMDATDFPPSFPSQSLNHPAIELKRPIWQIPTVNSLPCCFLCAEVCSLLQLRLCLHNRQPKQPMVEISQGNPLHQNETLSKEAV